jgi:uroporphyrin-3 C-methyltransferase
MDRRDQDSDKRDEQSPLPAEAPEEKKGEQAVEEGAEPAAPEEERPEDNAAAGVSPAAFGFWLALVVLALGAAGAGGGWYFWQQAERQRAVIDRLQAVADGFESQLGALKGEIESNRSAVASLESRSEAIRQEVEQALSAQQKALDERQDRLAARIAEIDDRLRRGEIAWKTAEVGFLLTRAQERLVISRDPDGAARALRLADERLAALSRPQWLPLRAAISDAIAELEAAGQADRVGLALTMRRLADGVENWPLAGGETVAEEASPDTTGSAATGTDEHAAWYARAWSGVTGWIGSQVSVTRSDRPVRLRERVATDREMRLWLTAVRESLLARDHDGLRSTLTEAESWLNEHYAAEADRPAAALEALESLHERFARRDFPSLDAVFEAWQQGSAREKARSAGAPDKEAER